MSTIPPLGPTPVPLGGNTLRPPRYAYFTRIPPDQRSCDRRPDLNPPTRKRTLVLCFDGTADSFDLDVSRLFITL